jgi:hypothetical protein
MTRNEEMRNSCTNNVLGGGGISNEMKMQNCKGESHLWKKPSWNPQTVGEIFYFCLPPLADFLRFRFTRAYDHGRRDTEDHDAKCSREFGCVLHRISKMSGGSWIKRKEGYECVPGLSKEET